MKIHPIADLFPLMDDARFTSFKENVRQNGQMEDITVFEGVLLDGRHRLRACLELGLVPGRCEWDGTGGTIQSFIVSKNLERNHLSDDERAIVAAKVANLPQGVSKANTPNGGFVSQSEAARLFNVSTRSLQRAVKVVKDGVPLLQEKLAANEFSLSEAASIAALPKGKQMRRIRKGRTETKKIILKKKTDALRRSSNSLLNDLLERPLTQEEFIAAMDLIAELQPPYKRYLDDVVNEITEENLSDETREAVERVLQATDYGHQTRAKISEKTKIKGALLDHVLTHCLEYKLLEIYLQGGKTDGARGARNTGYRRPGTSLAHIAAEETISAVSDGINFDDAESFNEKTEKIIRSLTDVRYQSPRHLSIRTGIPVSDVLLICQMHEEIDFQEVGSTNVFYLKINEPYGTLYNSGENSFRLRGEEMPQAVSAEDYFPVPGTAPKQLDIVQ
ncbi:MAG: helix-turn-helix domain-containing protein [Pyrinomonadaceae bacterium]